MEYIHIAQQQYKYDGMYRIVNLSNNDKFIFTLSQINENKCYWSIVNNIHLLPLYKSYIDKILIYDHIINNYYLLLIIWDYYMNLNLIKAIRDQKLLEYYRSLNIHLVQLPDLNSPIQYINYNILESYLFNDEYINNDILNKELLNDKFNNFKLELNKYLNISFSS